MSINNIVVEKATVNSTKSHSATYKLLRTFKTPQYDNINVLRNKKGFNTIGFNLNYDIVVCDRYGKTIDLLANKEVGFISKHYDDSHFIYFMTVGSINFYRIKIFDRIRLQIK